MTYIDPRNGEIVDTASENISQLIGLVKFLTFHHGAKTWRDTNASDADRLVVRHLRFRLFQENRVPGGRLLHCLNTIDPPSCRCGRKGTRILAGITFCVRCGPPSKMSIKAKIQRRDRDRALIAEDNLKISAEKQQSRLARLKKNRGVVPHAR